MLEMSHNIFEFRISNFEFYCSAWHFDVKSDEVRCYVYVFVMMDELQKILNSFDGSASSPSGARTPVHQAPSDDVDEMIASDDCVVFVTSSPSSTNSSLTTGYHVPFINEFSLLQEASQSDTVDITTTRHSSSSSTRPGISTLTTGYHVPCINEFSLRQEASQSDTVDITTTRYSSSSSTRPGISTLTTGYGVLSNEFSLRQEASPPSDISSVYSSSASPLSDEDMTLQLNQYETRIITSPHDTRKYHAYQIGTDPRSLIEFYNWINITCELDDIHAVTKAPPWHVTETCTFIIDLKTFNDRRDAFVDGWTWDGAKTYRTYGDLGLDHIQEWSKIPQTGKYCFVKRSWTCRQSDHIRKYLTAVYKPSCAFNRQNPLENAERYAIVQYMFQNFTTVIPPTDKARVYPSVKGMVRNNLEKTMGPKRALFCTETEVGCVMNAINQSALPTIKNAYDQSRQLKSEKTAADPLRQLTKEQHEDNANGCPLIRKILHDETSFSVVLYNDRMILNIGNFCCASNFKSALKLDFTFELFKNPPCFALITTFSNTSLQTKRAPHHSPELLDPILLTHFRSENCVNALFDAIIHENPGLKSSVKVIGADGERSFTNVALTSFEKALLLLCYKHEKDNVSTACTNLKLDEWSKGEISHDLFGTSYDSGLLDSQSFAEYDDRVTELLKKWDGDNEMKKFAPYFVKNKKEEFKYHVCTAAVNNAQVCDLKDRFYNNACESKNNLIKAWQNYGKVDMVEFKKKFKEVVLCEENNVTKAFLGLDGPYIPRQEFSHLGKEYSLFRNMTPAEQSELQKKWLNVIVDKDSSKEVTDYNEGRLARKRAIENAISITPENPAVPLTQQTAATAFSDAVVFPTSIDIESLEYLLTEALPDESKENILGSVLKAKSILMDQSIRMGFTENTLFVKSSKNPAVPHVVRSNGDSITCDDNCIRFKYRHYCGHCIAVSLALQKVDRYVIYLASSKETLTTIASKNVNRRVAGAKAPKAKRCRKGPSPIKAPCKTTTASSATVVNDSSAPSSSTTNISVPIIQTNQYGQKVTPPGQKMGRKPGVPETPNDYVMYPTSKRRGKVCNGCNGELDEDFSIYRLEAYWYPNVNDDGTRSWRRGKPANKYYHVQRKCFHNHTDFLPSKIKIDVDAQEYQHCMDVIDVRFNA